MNIPKRYGESKIENCPFCGRQAIVENDQGVPVCSSHKDTLMPELKCICGQYLFMQKGKFGVYFNCLKCGNMNLKKALEINDIMKPMPVLQKIDVNKNKSFSTSEDKESPKNIVIRSDDPDYFD